MIQIKILDRGVKKLLRAVQDTRTGLIIGRIPEREIEFDALRGHRHKVNGRTFIADETITKYDAVRIATSGRVVKAQATTNSTVSARVVGVATANAVVDQKVSVVTWGEVSNSSWSFQIGEAVYVSATAGALTSTPPGATLYKGTVGLALDTTTVLVDPDHQVTKVAQ